jgi:hypothetical protein
MLKVTVQGGKTKEVPYKAGMTCGDVLRAAEVTKTSKATVSINGKKVKGFLGFFWKKTPVADDSLIVVTPNISNG